MTKDTKQTDPRQALDNMISAPRVMKPAGLVVALVGAEPAAAQPGRFWVPNRIRVIFRPGAIEVPLPVKRFDLACGQPEASQDGGTVHGVPIRSPRCCKLVHALTVRYTKGATEPVRTSPVCE
jgi:hypothetical protein